MATPEQIKLLTNCYHAAKEANHIFPEAAACEGALETSWFTSKLYLQANNVFGLKSVGTSKFETLKMVTSEYIHNTWVSVPATWIKYPTLADCLADRMETLKNSAHNYPHYAAALAAKTPEDFLTNVSLSWSTDPLRGQKCLQILNAHKDVFNANP